MEDEFAKPVGRKRPKPDAARIGKRVALALADVKAPCCQEAKDRVPKEVRPLNAGFFALEAMRHANVSAAKARKKSKAKVRGK